VLQLDPEHVEAGEPLSQLYFKREEWAPLVPILEMLARKADRKTNRELTLLYHRLAKAADKLGDNEKALKYYKQSYDLDSTYLPTLIDRAGLLYSLEHWDDAFRIYQTILVTTATPEGRSDRRHLLPPRAHQAEARRAHQGGEHVREGAGDPARPPSTLRRSSTSTPTRATSRR
jgi:tetratricopeptide (TPR) repeat protein